MKYYKELATHWPFIVGAGAALLGWRAFLLAAGIVLAVHHERFKREEKELSK